MTPIALVVMAAATAAYAFFIDRSTVSDADRNARKRDVFPSFRIDDVRKIELSHGAEALVLEREAGSGDRWQMTSPVQEPADPAKVDVLMRELEMATRVRDVPPAEAAGMDSPRVRGRVTVGPVEYRFALGDDAPVPPGAAYMRVDGEGTFVAARSVSVQLLRGAEAYRDRTLVPYGAGEVARLEIRSPARTWTLERAGATFRVGGSTGLRASRSAVDRLFTSLADVRAETFLDDPRADAATDAPALSVVIAPRDTRESTVRFVVGGACPGHAGEVVVVREKPRRLSACSAQQAVAALGEAPDSLVDRSPFFARADEIEELRLESTAANGPRVDVARRGTAWHERAPEDRDLTGDEADSVNGLVKVLSDSRALDARPDHGEALAAHWRATAVRAGTEKAEGMELYSPGGDGTVLARRLDDGAILRLAGPVARRFEPHPVAFRSAAVWQAPFDAASVVAIDDSCGPRRRLAMRDGSWRTGGGAAVDARAPDELIAAFAHARAESWVTEGDDGTFGLTGRASCSVALTLETDDGGTRRVGLVFGSTVDGGVYAMTLDGGGVLVAPASLRESAESLLGK